MTNRSLVRRLERLEERHDLANKEPTVIVIEVVDASGQVVERFRMTPKGPQPLSPEEEHSRPSRHEEK
ncbi:MAG: hypothetical protein ABSH24_36045 [Bryobacteraceae bacterium]|jgi:hypothetical protein